MKTSQKDYENIKEWYCKYRGIQDEGLYWNQSVIIGGKFTHSDEMEVLQDFYESDFISQMTQIKLDKLECMETIKCKWTWDKIRKEYDTECGACFDTKDRIPDLKYTDMKYCPFCSNEIQEINE